MNHSPLGLGIVGAGGFAGFAASAVCDLPGLVVRKVADTERDRAAALASRFNARVSPSWVELVHDSSVDVVLVATPPAAHASIARAALQAGRHVFCEKPLSVSAADAASLIEVVEQSDRVLVVDHVLRYNPILRALTRLSSAGAGSGGLLGRLQRFCFENDASDEDLGPDHWFWDAARSGGIFVEHGVHFFDAATMLVGRPPTSVQASSARRSTEGPVDLVSATLRHGPDVLATHTHSFTHAHRCERQLMRLDYGTAEVRVEGWIPVDAVIDLWTDDAGARAAEDLPDDLLQVDGFRLGPHAAVNTSVSRDAGPASARGRGLDLDIPHHVRIHLTLGGAAAKQTVYAESVRAAMADLICCATSDGRPSRRPFSGVREGAAAVLVAAAATRALHEGRTIPIDHDTTNEET
jgi:predicted dehydrogenase